MTQQKTNSDYLQALKNRVLILDGAMGTNLQKQYLTAEQFGSEKLDGCYDYLVLTTPNAVEKVHRSFLDVGVDIIETNTFRANRISLNEYGLQNKVVQINQLSAALARRLADSYSTPDQPRFVAGSMGPTGQFLSSTDPELCKFNFDEITDVYREQALGLISGGVNVLLIETAQDILEVKAAITGIHLAFKESDVILPIQTQVTLDSNGRMLLGTDISAVLAILAGMPMDVIGINCSTGPEHMREPIRYLAEHSQLPVSCSPNAGFPLSQKGEVVYPLQPQEFADQLTEFVEKFGINVVGGCCGTTPEHLRLLVERVHGKPAVQRHINRTASLASAMHALPLRQEPAPLIIGERLNTQGSHQFKQVVLDEDWEAALSIARQQVENGAHALDVCIALTEKTNEAETMQKMAKLLSSSINAPLVIDTTDPLVMEIALKNTAGRCLLNSVNLENGPEKAGRIFSLARQFNAVVICLTIDEAGLAKSAKRKLEISKLIYQLATQNYHLDPCDLVFDPLTFTLASGDRETANAAVETLDAIKLIKKELPGVFTSLGISNVSFGLTQGAREVLNSIMLFHALHAGLDLAIINPSQITPYLEIPAVEKKLAEDLIFNREPKALAYYIAHFEHKKVETITKELSPSWQSLPIPERLTWRILNRVQEGIEAEIDELVHAETKLPVHENALHILNTILLPAMQLVGERFGEGEVILPFVLQSAEVMKTAVSHLEQYMEHGQTASQGKIVLATVYGDVHDIGKNLVKTILTNNGYDVIDLGKQVPAKQIIETAIKEKADAIGLSALLVSTSQQMASIVNELQREGLHIPVLIGGAAINQKFAERITINEDGNRYQAGVFYCRDAFDALSVLNRLKHIPTPSRTTSPSNEQDLDQLVAQSVEEIEKKNQVTIVSIPKPPFWGVHAIHTFPLEEVLVHLNKKALYRLSWGAKNAQGEKWDKLVSEFNQRLDKILAELRDSSWLDLSAVYGYWPVQSQENSLVIYSPDSGQVNSKKKVGSFILPRQKSKRGLCLADYFASAGSNIMDVAAMQIVTVGKRAVDHIKNIYESGNITDGYYAHGLAAQLTEALAETLYMRIRSELKILKEQGKRYSWGYPAIPDLSQHALVFDLLHAREELGMSLTSAYQLVPELSTAALIVHNPNAEYFSMH